MSEFTEGISNFDAKLWRTLPALLTRPGLLTAEFNAGRRTRYVHPFRVYLFVTFVFFGLLATFGNGTKLVQIDVPVSARSGPAPDDLVSQVLIAGEAKLRKADDKDLANQFAERLPQVMFVVLPMAALLLMAAYGRRHFYVEHLVFVTHVHSFVFLVFALSLPLLHVLPGPLIQGFSSLAALVYFVVALKRTYGEGLGVTLGKAFVLAIAYGALSVTAIVATTLIVALVV